MPVSRRLLHALSRDPRFLARAAALILATFGVAGWIAGRSAPEDAGPFAALKEYARSVEEETDAVAAALRSHPPDRWKLLDFLRARAGEQRVDDADRLEATFRLKHVWRETTRKLLENAPLPEEERALFARYFTLASGSKPPPPEEVAAVEAAALPDLPALPPVMAGDLRMLRNEEPEAFALYERARLLPGGETAATRRAVEQALRRGRTGILTEWMEKPGAREAVYAGGDTLFALDVAAETRDVLLLFAFTARHSLEALKQPDWLILTLLAGGVWFASLHKACGVPLRRWWPGALAVVLGMLSTVVALVFALVQESRGGLAETGDPANDFLFFVAGVGLREELAKLLLFLPLLPLLRKATPAQAFAAASCVGLGFAMKENLQYYLRSDGLAAISRFFSANFLHVAFTGLAGLAAFQAARRPRPAAIQGFLAVFLAMVLLHGVYNYILSAGIPLRGLEEDSPFAALAVILGLAWFYFQTLEQNRDPASQTITPQAVLTLGVAVIVGVTFCVVSGRLGPVSALKELTPSVLSDVILAALFIQRLR